MFGADDEFILSRLRRQHRTTPADGELIGFKLRRFRPVNAEIELNDGIEALDNALASAPESPRFEVFALQAALTVPLRRAAKCADQVSRHMSILPHCQTRQFDAGRLVTS